MTMKKTIAKLIKLTGQHIAVDCNNLHYVCYNGYTISFYPNGPMNENAEATNFYTKKIGLQDDLQSDYFAGTFHENITQAFKFVERISK